MDLANEIRDRFPSTAVSVGYPDNISGNVNLVLNATSLGLKVDDALPFDENQFNLSHAEAVFDMIYQPAETPLLAKAEAAGCRTANGLGMLLWQGGESTGNLDRPIGSGGSHARRTFRTHLRRWMISCWNFGPARPMYFGRSSFLFLAR